jgi:hypothetical protein
LQKSWVVDWHGSVFEFGNSWRWPAVVEISQQAWEVLENKDVLCKMELDPRIGQYTLKTVKDREIKVAKKIPTRCPNKQRAL